MQNLVPARTVVPEFEPVPRKYRYDGWTAERQRGFIEALAETGSVRAAARRINMSPEGAYYIRRAPGAESFRAAWSAALNHGVQRLADVAIDRALEGVPVPIFWRGEQVGEKRWFNDRLLMFILRHHLPERYGLRNGTRHPDTIAREAAENCPVCKARAAAEADPSEDEAKERSRLIRSIFERYGAKVRAERQLRLNGQIVAADFTLRQLTHLELILDCGGRAADMIHLWTSGNADDEAGETDLWASPISEELDRTRRAVWEANGEPARPPLPLARERAGTWMWGGPTHAEREKARKAAERRMAQAQREWEATACEDSWAEWTSRPR